MVGLEQEKEEGDIRELGQSTPTIHTSFKPKIIEILKKLHHDEVKIYSEASKEFISLLKGGSGGDILSEYISLSPKCLEILETWRLHQAKPGLACILTLISVIFDHPSGKSRTSRIFRIVNNLAYDIFKDKLEEIYGELNSQEHRRQNAALSLLASIVKRGIGLASEVAKSFDFKLPVLSKLSGIRKMKDAKKGTRRSYTRWAFIRFAMSFLEVGNPRLLRWILQQRELYSGVFRGIGGDDVETIVYVLSTLRDKVLTEDSLIPPGLRSVLFGSITLEQLSNISGNPMAGPAADLAHEVLVMACTDPCNGLMPNKNLKGNEKRLFDLMKKLKATEAANHKELLLAIVRMRPSFCAAYMDEFPYNLKPRSSSSWFSAVCLAADMISSINSDTLVAYITFNSCDEPAMDNHEVQNILKCIVPCPLTRSVISTGLQHAEEPVKHGTLRVVLESLKLLARLLLSIDRMIESMLGKQDGTVREERSYLDFLPGINSFAEHDKCLAVGGISCCASYKLGTQKWISLKQSIQDEVRAMSPEPQILLKLLSSSGHKHSKHSGVNLKRCADLPGVGVKKLKPNNRNDDIDIIIGGIDAEHTSGNHEDLEAQNIVQELDVQKDDKAVIAEIWGLSEQTVISKEQNGAENFFQCKLLDTFKFYLRTVPLAIEGSYDFFKILPHHPSSFSSDQLQSLLLLLLEHIQQAPGGRVSVRAPKFMYKHLQRLLNILIYSNVKAIQEQAYILARAAMISTGAFDQNFSEIDSWLSSLTGYCLKTYSADSVGAEAIHSLSMVVTSFLCDCVSTVGNNLYKYLHQMRELISMLENVNGESPGFSPLVICVLEKCFRLLESESRTHKLCDKSMISLYTCNTINLILQTQVDARTLSGLLRLILEEKFDESPAEDMYSKSDLCEWRPVKNLLCFAQYVFYQDSCSLFSISKSTTKQYDGSFFPVLLKIKELLEGEHGDRLSGVSVAFSSSIICATSDDILTNFLLLLTVTEQHFRCYLPFLSHLLLVEQNFLAKVADLWSGLLSSGLKLIEGIISKHKVSKIHLLESNEVLQCMRTADLLDSTELASSAAFSLFLYNAPFYALFSAIMSLRNVTSREMLDTLYSKAMLNLLQFKLSEGSPENYITYVRHVLFWTNQTMSSSRTNASDVLEKSLQMCITLFRYLLDRILVMIADTSSLIMSRAASVTCYVQDVIDLIFQHPIVTFALSQPFCFSTLGNNVQDIMSSEKLHPIDCNMLQLLTIAFDFAFSVGKLCNRSSGIHECSPRLILSAPRKLIEESVETLRSSILKRDVELLLPRFYVLDGLKQFVSPFELLEIVDWMFNKVEDSDSGSTSSFATAAVYIGLYMMDGALGMLFSYLKQPRMNSEFNWLWNRKAENFNLPILVNLYHKILEFGMHRNLQCADICLLKIVTAVCNQRSTNPDPTLFPLFSQLSRMVTNSPMKMLCYCCYPTNKIKGKILLQLIEGSPMHMNLFGKIFLGILNNEFPDLVLLSKGGSWPAKCTITIKKSECAFSNDDYVLLLPGALSYVMFIMQKYQKCELKPLRRIARFYYSMLLDGFSNWKDYVSQDIFQEEYDELVLTSPQDFHKIFSSTLLGKAVTMLRYSFVLRKSQVKEEKLLGIFDSICSDASLFDPYVMSLNFGTCSYKESLKIVDTVAAKVSFARLLLFPPESSAECSVTQANKKSNEIWMGMESIILDYAKRFMGILVNSLEHIITKIPLQADSSDASCSTECYPVLRFLEHYILSNIVQLTMDMQSYLRESLSIPILHQLICSSLHHRFEDPFTLRAVRCIIVVLSRVRFYFTDILALLVRHPKFVPTISRCCSDSSTFVPCGTLLQPLPSILKSLDISYVDQTAPENMENYNASSKLQYNHYSFKDVKLEVVKLLRILYHLKGCQQNFGSANVNGESSGELLSLLLSGYGATMSDIDLEIFHLMHEIEPIERSYCGSIADVDYIWGGSAVKFRNELALNGLSLSNLKADSETMEERRRMLFRENIPVDSKLSMMTVLHFCHDRSSITAPMLLKRLLEDKFVDGLEKISSSTTNMVQRYDPAFILRFSNHCLSMGYLEPTEFSRLGLLGITFVSISSPDEELRKLGYGCLVKFKRLLENYQKRKDILQLQLLLTYVQNGIMEQWQRIPSVISMFAAEASLVLLDPSQNHFFTLSEFLMHSHRMNVKMIPLFPKLFRSGTIHFKTDRLWILQLLYAGLNSDTDAEIYKKQEVPKLLLSFFVSSLSDHRSKILILQIMKKCVKLPTIALCLIKKHGLISWLSSILLFYVERLARAHKELSMEVIDLVLKVINDGISSGTISEWLQEDGFQQLSDLSSHLHVLVVRYMKSIKGNISLVNSLLNVIVLTFKLSQNRDLKPLQGRKVYQPHFTLSLVGLFQLCQAVNVELGSLGTISTGEIALNIILMSPPLPAATHLDKEILSKLVARAVPAALQLYSMHGFLANDPDPDLLNPFKEQQGEESLVSKLLRWVSASVIIGSMAVQCPKMYSLNRSKFETLHPILEEIIKQECDTRGEHSSFNEALAVLVLYFQQLLGRNCNFLPSVILALCLLLVGNLSSSPDCNSFEEIPEAIVSLCSKIHCPPEVNPDWRWSYDKPWLWKDEGCSQVRTARECMEEEQACQSILLMFSSALGGKYSSSSALHKDVESFGLYEWEREIFLKLNQLGSDDRH